MSGNVWEWTLSKYTNYPYNPEGREDLQSDGEERRVLRGGAFSYNSSFVRCAVRSDLSARYANYYVGFRVVLSSLPSVVTLNL